METVHPINFAIVMHFISGLQNVAPHFVNFLTHFVTRVTKCAEVTKWVSTELVSVFHCILSFMQVPVFVCAKMFPLDGINHDKLDYVLESWHS